MPTPLSPWSVRLRELLADGQWRRRDELVAIAGPLIPPGRAMRERARRNDWGTRRRQDAGLPTGPRPDRSDDLKLAVGRRSIITATLLHSVAYEHKTDERGVVWVRLAR